MKEKSVGNPLPLLEYKLKQLNLSKQKNKYMLSKMSVKSDKGFSTLELMIAFAIIAIVLVGAVGANFAAQYWSIISQTSNEALYKAKTKLEDLRALTKEDFYQATSTPLTKSVDLTDPADASCVSGGLCYFVQTTITDMSSCSKYVEARVDWQVQNYSTTTTSLFTNLTNSPEIIARGGDCILNQPAGDWKNTSPQNVGFLSFSPGKQFTGIDVLHKKIYATASSFPSFLVYDAPVSVGQNPAFYGSLNIVVSGQSRGLNSIDVEEDLATGRTYAFAAVNATTSQLAVVDVTDAHNPTLVAQRDLQGVNPLGSYPQGWRVFIYGGRLYMTTRETAGNEFHIFDISTPTLPTEIGNGFKINRTVNEILVRDQKIGGTLHRLVFLASDSDLKELGVLDVTNDVITELYSVDLPGAQDGLSMALLGNNLYFGRSSNTAGPELYVFDVSNPGVTPLIIGQGEVGASVTKIDVSGAYAYLGTTKSGQEFQVWNSDFTIWNQSTPDAGFFKSYNFAHLALLGFDIDGDWVYAVSQFATGDALQIIYTP